MKHSFIHLITTVAAIWLLGSCYDEQHFDMPGPYGEKEIVPDTMPFPFDSTRQAGIWIVKDGVPDFSKILFKGFTDFVPNFGTTSFGETKSWFQEEGRYTSYQAHNPYAGELGGGEHLGNYANSYQYTYFFTKPFIQYFPGSKWYFYAKMSLPGITGSAPHFWFGGKAGYSKRHTCGIDGGNAFNGNPIFFMQVDGQLINDDTWPIMTEVLVPGEPFELELVCVDYFVYFKVNGTLIWYYNLPQDVHSVPIMFAPWRNAVSLYDVYMEGDIEEEMMDFVCQEKENGYEAIQAPALTRADNGDILLFAEGRVGCCEPTTNSAYVDLRPNRTDIVMKRSSDDGETWSDLSVAVGDGNTGYMRPTAITDNNGTVHLLYTKDESQYLDGSTFQIYHRSSTDNGQSWSEPQAVANTLTGYASTTSGHGLALLQGDRAGRLVALTTCATNTVAALYSDDHGATWQFGAPVNINSVTDGNLTELPDGRLMAILSHSGTTPACVVAYSDDGGATWDEDSLNNYGSLSTGGSGHRFAGATVTRNDGSIVHFTPQTYRSSFTYNSTEMCENVMYGNPAYGKGIGCTVSTDNGETWSDYEDLFTKQTYDAYYVLVKKMDAIALRDGRALCITESGIKCPKEGLVKYYK